MESLMQDLQTMENMRREIEIGEEVKGETEPKHLFKRRQRFLFPLRRYQKENTTKFQVGEFSVPTQRPRNNQSVIGGKEHYDTIIVPGTQNG